MQDSFKNWHTLGYFNRIDSELFFREKVAKQWIDSGAIMGMGTDSGTPMNFHTEALWREMKAHVDMGMSPARVIVAATRINATRVLGRTDLGTIEPGKLADVIVVNGDPNFRHHGVGARRSGRQGWNRAKERGSRPQPIEASAPLAGESV